MAQIGPFQVTESWQYALVGGLFPFPFTALEVWRSPESVVLEMVVVGSVIAGYLIKRRSGNSTVTGLRAALIGGLPALWTVPRLFVAIANVPNPPWLQAASVLMTLAFGGLVLLLLATLGALAGRFGGWIAERRGHSG